MEQFFANIEPWGSIFAAYWSLGMIVTIWLCPEWGKHRYRTTGDIIRLVVYGPFVAVPILIYVFVTMNRNPQGH